MRAFPDALDLMLICVESGMSIESAFTKVAAEIGTQSVELAEELALTTAELSYLPDRRQAFDNLAKRCGHSGVKAVAIALNQAEKYGTPMGQALRVTATGKSRDAHAGGRTQGRLTARQADRADDHLLPAVPVRRDLGSGDHEDHAHYALDCFPSGPGWRGCRYDARSAQGHGQAARICRHSFTCKKSPWHATRREAASRQRAAGDRSQPGSIPGAGGVVFPDDGVAGLLARRGETGSPHRAAEHAQSGIDDAEGIAFGRGLISRSRLAQSGNRVFLDGFDLGLCSRFGIGRFHVLAIHLGGR